MSGEDEWVRVALADDKLVADTLLNFNQQQSVLPLRKPEALRLQWSVRQRRSSFYNSNNNNINNNSDAGKLLGESKKASKPARASPTTPLSWSSAAEGGLEENSCLSVVRSKVETTTTKRPRKKKTLAEVKEEESLLLEERVALKSRLEALKLVVVEQRVKNESLKRLKIDLVASKAPEAVKSEKVHLCQPQFECDPTCSISSIRAGTNKLEQSLPDCSSQAEEIQMHCIFLLPDLNVPIEEDLSSNILYGTC